MLNEISRVAQLPFPSCRREFISISSTYSGSSASSRRIFFGNRENKIFFRSAIITVSRTFGVRPQSTKKSDPISCSSAEGSELVRQPRAFSPQLRRIPRNSFLAKSCSQIGKHHKPHFRCLRVRGECFLFCAQTRLEANS